jgi:hypothetical protein
VVSTITKDGKKPVAGVGKIFGKPGVHGTAEMKDRILYRQAIETARCMKRACDERARRQYRLHIRLLSAWTGGAAQYVNSGVAVRRARRRAGEEIRRAFAPLRLRDRPRRRR